MPSLTGWALGGLVVGGAVATAGLTGGLSVLVGSAILGAGAYKAHDTVVGNAYREAETELRRELAALDKESPAAHTIRCRLDRLQADRNMICATSSAVGIGTFLCPVAGVPITAALILGALRRE